MSSVAATVIDFPQNEAQLHYVYELRDSDGEVFYVGKGSGSRAFSHILTTQSDANREKAAVIEAAIAENRPLSIHIIEWFREPKAALAAEKSRISELGSLTNGKVGRPAGATYPKRLTVRLSEECEARLGRCAAADGRTMAEMARLLIEAALERGKNER